MSTNETREEKSSALTELDFDQKTRKRACWEAFAFEIVAENQIKVINESYGEHKKDDHAYIVTVEQRPDGTIVPLHCDCPAAMHHDGACKHQVAAAVRRVVLGAAVAYRADPDTNAETQVMLADGGQVVAEDDSEDTAATECVADENWCSGPESDDLPCFECFRAR